MLVHMNKDTIPLKAILFVLLLAMLWGGNAVALKIGFLEFMPLASAGLRFSTAALLIIVWAYPFWPAVSEITGEKTKFVSPEKKLFENEKVTVLSLRTNGNIQVSSQKTGPCARKLSG